MRISTSLRHFELVLLIILAWSFPIFCGEIHDAAKAGDLTKVKALLKDDLKLVYSRDDVDGSTPLHIAAKNGHMDVAELLLAKDAEVNAKTKNENFFESGATPLHVAANKEVAALLLVEGAEVDARNNLGLTPLHRAAMNGHKDVAEVLLANKADVNAKNKGGMTPLHMAAQFGRTDVAELLLAHGAEVDAKENSGWTPLYLAARLKHTSMMELLQQHGGHE